MSCLPPSHPPTASSSSSRTTTTTTLHRLQAQAYEEMGLISKYLLTDVSEGRPMVACFEF